MAYLYFVTLCYVKKVYRKFWKPIFNSITCRSFAPSELYKITKIENIAQKTNFVKKSMLWLTKKTNISNCILHNLYQLATRLMEDNRRKTDK